MTQSNPISRRTPSEMNIDSLEGGRSSVVERLGRFRESWISNKTLWITTILIVSGIRMWLVSCDEIASMKYDSKNYAFTSSYLFETSPDARLPTHRPGIAIFGWLTTQVGLPYKMVVDFFLMAVAAISGILVHRLMKLFAAGLFVYLALAFNPWFIAYSQLFMTEPIIGVLMMSIMLSSIQMLVRPVGDWSLLQVLLAGVATAAFDLSRNEGPLLLLFWFAVFLVVLIRQRKLIFSRKIFTARSNLKIAFVAVPVLMSFLAASWVRQHNEKKFGVSALCCTEADGFSDLMDALYSVVPNEKLRYAPVTTDSIAQASEVSPTLRLYSERLLDSTRPAFGHCKRKTGYENQFGTWLNWHLLDAFQGMNPTSNKEMAKAAREIKSAQYRGDLKMRFGKFPIHPEWSACMSDVWVGLKHAYLASLVDQEYDCRGHVRDLQLTDSADESLFDRALLRRASVGLTNEVIISGRLPGTKCSSDLVRLYNKDGRMLVTVPVTFDDYDKHFRFSIVLDEIELKYITGPLSLSFVDNNSESGRFRSPTILLKQMRMSATEVTLSPFNEKDAKGPAPSIEHWYVSTIRLQPDRGDRSKTKLFIQTYYHWLAWIMLALGMVAGVLFRGTRQEYWDVVWVCTAALVFVFARNMLYSLLDAWVGWGINRYVEPNNFLFLFGLACAAFVIGRQAIRLFGVTHKEANV